MCHAARGRCEAALMHKPAITEQLIKGVLTQKCVNFLNCERSCETQWEKSELNIKYITNSVSVLETKYTRLYTFD